MKNELVDFENNLILVDTLDLLLKDMTTGENITWGMDGEGHKATDQITIVDVENICPRVLKRLSEQKERTRKKAEVFTPTHICKKMVDLLEEERKSVEWADHINQTVLEVTCGEAPFVASRYDTTTGEVIPANERTGLLDKKLQRIPEGLNPIEWYYWVLKALETTYGYEYQGDNLLLARCNVLLDVFEHYHSRYPEECIEITASEVFAEIVARNFWQMDGLTGLVPGTDIPAKITDWKAGKEVEFNSLKENNK